MRIVRYRESPSGCVRIRVALSLLILPVACACHLRAAKLLDIAPSGQLTTWTDAGLRRLANVHAAVGASNLGEEWDEERDVREIRVRYNGTSAKGAAVEYWFKYWPYDPPKMPTIEDPMDDPWQGKWLKAETTEICDGAECRYDFKPLAETENPRADKLPGVVYRRTLKARLIYAGGIPDIASLNVFTGTEQKPVNLRVEFSPGEITAHRTSTASVYNGILRSVKPWQVSKGLLLDLIAAKPNLPGSHDLTVVTIHATPTDTFSFRVDDLKHGPISIPQFHARIADITAGTPQAPAAPGKLRVRERIPREPEQTYQRASREIPPLDPWNREGGGRVYLPLAPDSDWQKFAFEYGGNVFISKRGIKAKGRELARLQWTGDTITWKIGMGATPYYRDDRKVAVRILDGYLPVVTQRWENEGLRYDQEAYATLLRGPLSPTGSGRDEETPAILMMRLAATNSTRSARKAEIWLSVDGGGILTVSGKSVYGNGKLIAELGENPGAVETKAHSVHISFDVPPSGSNAVVFKLPAVSDLNASDIDVLNRLHYSSERQQLITYWKSVIDPAVRFRVPEPKFNALARAVIAHIHISTTKDPKTGLYMVPAASYSYDEFENEACYQVLLLDTLGQFDAAASYLEPMMRLQGSQDFPGAHKGPQDAIFHGTKIDDVYNYTEQGYGLDHGTVLWTLAQHYLYTRDKTWLEHAWPHMKKGIDWIVEQRSTTKLTDIHGQKIRAYGLLPASQLEDNADWANWFPVNAYAWAGMFLTSEALADIGNPEAANIRKKADEFRADLRSAILRSVEAAPVVRMQDGTYEPYVPVLPTRRFRLFGPIRMDYYQRYPGPRIKPLLRLGADRDTLCGAVVLLILNVFSSNEPITNWILNDWEDNETLSSGMGMNIHGMTDDRYWFSQGGMVFQANLVNPIQVYLRLHEAQAAIRNLYNDFVTCLYPEVNQFTEEFHQWRHGSGPFYKISDESRFVNRVRDTLVFEDQDSLWLAAGTPRRWLDSKDGIHVNRVQTFFGPASYDIHRGRRPGMLEATVELPSSRPPKHAWLVARVPSGHIQSVTVNGKPWSKVNRRLEAIELPQQQGSLKLAIRYQ